ncbi:MAG: hypothetical protein EON89_02595 [Brevundimonas sp.]|nr:MAG: hypothetical protein EON89_02595 [Brevundimonas sp.]
MFRSVSLAMAASLVGASMAMAQDEQPPSASEIAAAHAEADRLITAGEASDIFENATDSDLVTVRHRPSGLLCHFIGDQGRDRLVVIQSGPRTGAQRGNDVACNTLIGDIELTLYFTRYSDDHSPEDETRLAVEAITDRFPDLKPHEGDLTIVPGLGGDPNWAAFDLNVESRDLTTFVAVTKFDGWIVKTRGTGPLQDADHVSELATLLLMRAQPE